MRAEKGFTLFILNEDVNDTVKIIKWLEDPAALIDGVKHKIKNKNMDILGHILVASIVQPVISLVVKNISGRGVRKAGKAYMNESFSSALSFKHYQDY